MPNLDVFTAIWNTASPEFQERIPEPSQTALNTIGVMINSDDYQPIRNEIYDALVNLIGKQKVWTRSINNPLSMFKSGTMYFGDTYEEIISDVIKGEQFRVGSDDQFAKHETDVKAAYHRINREMVYPVTIEETKVNRAFMREGGLDALINSIVNQMYSSNDLDEYLYTKKALSMAFNDPKVPLASGQTLTVPDYRDNVLDTETVKAFVMTVKGVIRQMRFPKTVYNPYGLTLQSRPSDIVVMLRSDFAVVDEVSTLSQAFQPEFMDVNVPIIEVDDFGDGMEKVVGIVMEKQTLRIIDTLRTVRTAENSLNLYRNYFYHVHQLYSVSPLTNMVFLTVEDSEP